MTKRINYQIVDKDGKIVEDMEVSDYEKLADHLLEMADKYYQGIYTVDDSINISTFDETGNLIYEDTASFGSSEVTTEDIANELRKYTDS